MTTLDDVFKILLDRDYAPTLFGAARPDGRDNRKADCPICGGNDLSYSLSKPLWHCYNCGAGGNWIGYLKAADGINGGDAARKLAAAAGIKLDLDKGEQRRSLLEAIREAYWQLCIKAQREDHQRAADAVEHLKERGYTAEARQNPDLAFALSVAPDPNTAQAALIEQGFTLPDIKAAGLIYDGGKFAGWGGYRLVIRWESLAGRLDGFVWRNIFPSAEGAKYLYSAGLARNEGLIGLGKAAQLLRKQAAAEGRAAGLILTEGVMDTIALNNAGLPAAAVGGVSISEHQIGKLQQAGVAFVYVALDNDKTGQSGILRMVRTLQKNRIEAYIWQPEDYHGVKDTEELFLKHGGAAITAACANALPVGDWLARQIASAYPDALDPDAHPQDRRKLLHAARGGLADLQMPEDRAAFLSELPRLTRLEPDVITAGIAEIDAKVKWQQTASEAAKTAREMVTALEEGSLTRDEAAGAAAALTAIFRRAAAPELPPRYPYPQWIADLAAKPEGLPVYWTDKYVLPAGAITIVAATTGGGKTTLLLNLLADWLKTTDGGYIFLSYEERREDLILKLAMILAGVVIEESTNYNAVLGYVTGQYHGEPIPQLDKALDLIDTWLTDGRLTVLDQSYTVEQLEALIEAAAARQPPQGILLDYIQKIPLGAGRGNVRYLDIQQVSAALLGTAVRHNLPLVIGSQLNEDGRAREGKDIEFDAAVVLKLQMVETEGSKGEEQQPLPIQAHRLHVHVIKNRAGWKGTDDLYWNKPSRVISLAPTTARVTSKSQAVANGRSKLR